MHQFDDGHPADTNEESFEGPEGERGFRRDALPENIVYRDDGCDAYPSCLRCPLVRCRYDEPGGLAAVRRTARDEAIRRLHGREGMTVDGLAEMFGVSSRTIFRVVKAGRS